MSTTTTVAAGGPSFPNVSALAEPYGAKAAKELREAYWQLHKVGAPSAAERLAGIDENVPRLEFPEIDRLAAPDYAIDELSEAQQRRVQRAHSRRNVAALIPLLATWLALAWASYLYHNELASHPKMSNRSFLVLWDERFGGHVIPTFSETALLDALLLIIVVILTVRVHMVQTSVDTAQTHAAASVQQAMATLAVAMKKNVIPSPTSAEEWAAAAQRIIADAMKETRELAAASRSALDDAKEATQRIAADAMKETRELAAASQSAIDDAKEAIERIQVHAEEFIANFVRESMATLADVRDVNKQVITQTAAEAKDVLEQVAATNRHIAQQQMNPLIDQLREMLAEFARHHESYRTGVAGLGRGVEDLSSATSVLASKAASYSEIAKSIDGHLRIIETSQADFISQVTASVSSMGAASMAMQEVSEVLRRGIREDLAHIAQNVVDASEHLTAAERSLGTTGRKLEESASAFQGLTQGVDAVTSALRDVTGELHAARSALRSTLVTRRPWWRRMPRRNVP